MSRYTTWFDRGIRPLDDLADIDPSKVFVFDTETTGLKAGDDEVLQFSACDAEGNELMNELFKPLSKTEWPYATVVNGIHPADVKGKRSFEDAADEVNALLDDAQLIVAYNLPFDAGFLRAAGMPLPSDNPVFDAMVEISAYVRTVTDLKPGRYVSLKSAAAHWGYDFSAHDALNDARATAFVYRNLLSDRSMSSYRAMVASLESNRFITEARDGSQSDRDLR